LRGNRKSLALILRNLHRHRLRPVSRRLLPLTKVKELKRRPPQIKVKAVSRRRPLLTKMMKKRLLETREVEMKAVEEEGRKTDKCRDFNSRLPSRRIV
jgi:hypothetical protein